MNKVWIVELHYSNKGKWRPASWMRVYSSKRKAQGIARGLSESENGDGEQWVWYRAAKYVRATPDKREP